MINYDMPWNPTRLEQRLGRIHRIGQDRDCYAFNFVATDSEDGQPIVEGRILHRLLEKLDTMNEALGGRVFDVIGEVLSLNDVNLPDMLREAAYDPRRLDEYLDQIDRIDPAKLKEYEDATGIALARSHVDFTGFQRRNLEVEEKRLMPRYVERVGHLKLGFDVRAHRVADEATGDVLVKRVEIKGRMRGQPVRLTTNEWYKAQQLAETYWLYVVWDPLGKTPELIRIQNPAVRLDHAKREIVAARFFEIPAQAVEALGKQTEARA